MNTALSRRPYREYAKLNKAALDDVELAMDGEGALAADASEKKDEHDFVLWRGRALMFTIRVIARDVLPPLLLLFPLFLLSSFDRGSSCEGILPRRIPMTAVAPCTHRVTNSVTNSVTNGVTNGVFVRPQHQSGIPVGNRHFVSKHAIRLPRACNI